ATYEHEIGHIDLARWADVALLAPSTADLIGRLAGGLADDLLTTVILATTAPVVVAPSMNTQMWRHALVQRNLETLRREAGYHVVDPDAGELACKEVGPGRLPDAPFLLDAVDRAVGPARLAGKRVIVTAGPTREHIDPARFISNPSSGRMGYAVARAAAILGAEVVLVSGPTNLDAPAGVRLIDVVDARQMHRAVMETAAEVDFICKAAAVCDFRPRESTQKKVSKQNLDQALELERNPDILAELGEMYGRSDDGPYLIGFAAESHDVVERARKKRERKKAHMIVANQIGGEDSAFGAERSKVHIIAEGLEREVGPAPKEEIAFEIWEAAVDERQDYTVSRG
ncbi:MAG: bifunctional phosphopantothenoylcysteine decarboxylase/phosphopantothenate--cysteine ligase CoaBC, partial [Persicimonas sp.]